jgi:hypothetical protein
MAIIEHARQFGTFGRLNGVLTTPDSSERVETVLILVSAGFTPKAGPYRLYTELARQIASQGIASFRFDLGGIGNSEVLDPGEPLLLRTFKDIRDAVDLVSDTLHPGQIVIGGLCSGAEDAFRYAEVDERITGVVLVDPHAYRTPMWWVRNVFSQMFLSRVIYKFLRAFGFINVVSKKVPANRPEGFEGDLVNYQYMKADEATRILRALNRRQVRYHYIFTGGRIDAFNHRGQFYSMFSHVSFAGFETITHLPHIEHVQVFKEDRNELIRVICSWAKIWNRSYQGAVTNY